MKAIVFLFLFLAVPSAFAVISTTGHNAGECLDVAEATENTEAYLSGISPKNCDGEYPAAMNPISLTDFNGRTPLDGAGVDVSNNNGSPDSTGDQ